MSMNAKLTVEAPSQQHARQSVTARSSTERFVAGAGAVLTAHQAAVWTLHRAGITPWVAYSFTPTAPLGVPHVLSAAFWGGVWWVALAPLVERAATPAGYWTRAATLGAVLPTLVGALLIAAGRGAPRGNTNPAVLLGAGLLVNALWGTAAGALVRGVTPARRPGISARTARRSTA